jgi:hypothetical protein
MLSAASTAGYNKVGGLTVLVDMTSNFQPSNPLSTSFVAPGFCCMSLALRSADHPPRAVKVLEKILIIEREMGSTCWHGMNPQIDMIDKFSRNGGVCVCFYLTSGGAEAHDPGPGGAHRTIGRQKAIRASWSV